LFHRLDATLISRMKSSMTSLSFPDLNVWLALVSHEHVHSASARRWWNSSSGRIAFCRLSQLGLLRLLTTAAVMGNKPLSFDEAWRVYDSLYADERVVFSPEHSQTDGLFRTKTTGPASGPKVWADAWLLAIAEAAGGVLVTFDKALATRGAHCLLSKRG
jgi:toxin-antitoxin system PIN domain toxin